MQRYGTTIRLPPEAEIEYKKYHQTVWPEVLHTISECNIRNYSIYLRGNILFAYFEYVGEDFAADMARMASDPKTQEWWTIMKSLQDPFSDRKPGDWWTTMQEVFHID